MLIDILDNHFILSICSIKGNELTDRTVDNFLLALQYQKTFMELHKTQTSTGLMRLVLNCNKFSSESEANMAKLNEILKARDPQTKAASISNPDPDTVSVQSGKESSLGRNMTKSSNYSMLSISLEIKQLKLFFSNINLGM